jgi:hypothetical protein
MWRVGRSGLEERDDWAAERVCTLGCLQRAERLHDLVIERLRRRKVLLDACVVHWSHILPGC